MQKDFDRWNGLKKNIHEKIENKFYRNRDVWWCSLGTNIGFEQDGVGNDSQRPVVVLRGFNKKVCLIIPLTTSEKRNKYHFYVGTIYGQENYAIISQIKLIDTKRLTNKIGFLEKSNFEAMRKAVKDLL